MDFTIEKVCKQIISNNNKINTIDFEVLLADFDENDIFPELFGKPLHSFVLRADFAIVIICRAGTLKLKLDLDEYVLTRNNLLIILPGVVCQSIEPSEDCHISVMGCNIQHFAEPNSNIALIPRRYLYNRPILTLDDGRMKEFLFIYDAIRRRIINPHLSFKKETVFALMQVLYLDMCTLMKESIENPANGIRDRNKTICDSFLKELVANGGINREISYYANRLCLTPKYLSRIVKLVSGKFAKEWIREYVILQAKTMLDSGQYTIQQVSDRLNFPNQSCFGTYFKTSVGLSPKAYMDNH